MKTSWWSLLILAGCMLLLVTTPASAGTPVPNEWIGIWDTETTTYDCDTNAILFHVMEPDTLCPGAVFEDPDGGGEFTLTCTSSADGNSYTSHCEGSSEVVPGCTAEYVYDATGTRTGESYTAVATTSITYVGDCFGAPNSCRRSETGGTRTGGAPTTCEGTPNEARSWGAVKAVYR